MSTILLADDNPHAQRMGREILSQEGHVVVTVPDGGAAMSYLVENRPDVVLVDVDMPGPSGFEICRYIKSSGALEEIKVVLLRSPLEPFDPAEADQVRPDGVLAKPLDAKALIRTIDFLIKKRSLDKSDLDQPISVDEEKRTEPKIPLEGRKDRLESFREAAGVAESSAGRTVAAPQPEEAVDAVKPSKSLVQNVFRSGLSEAERRTRVRAAVSDIFDALAPALIDSITDRVVEAIREDRDQTTSASHGSKQL